MYVFKIKCFVGHRARVLELAFEAPDEKSARLQLEKYCTDFKYINVSVRTVKKI